MLGMLLLGALTPAPPRVARPPIEITSPGSATAGSATVTVTGGRVVHGAGRARACPAVEKDILVVDFVLTAAAEMCAPVDVRAGNLRLTLPDGTSVAARTGATGVPVEVLTPGATLTGLTATFEIDHGLRGDLRLVVEGTFGSGDPSVPYEGAAAFTIPAP
jgi:hypothetical protein